MMYVACREWRKYGLIDWTASAGGGMIVCIETVPSARAVARSVEESHAMDV